MSQIIQYIPVIIPGLLGYISAMFCNVNKDSGKNVNFRYFINYFIMLMDFCLFL